MPRVRRPVLYGFEGHGSGLPAVRADRVGPHCGDRILGPHAHRYLEVLFFEQPAGRHRLGDDEWETEAGDLVLVAPGEVHEWDPCVLELDPRVWVVHFAAHAVGGSVEGRSSEEASVFPLLGGPLLLPFVRASASATARFRVPPSDRSRWSAEFEALCGELNQPRVGSAEAARAHLCLLLIRVARLAAGALGATAVRDEPILEAVFVYIDTHFRRPISLADVAVALGRSPAYLTTVVRTLSGRTVLEWIIERRMAEARRLLRETDRMVADVAEAVSYVDASYFARQFRRAHGEAPAAWRRASRQ